MHYEIDSKLERRAAAHDGTRSRRHPAGTSRSVAARLSLLMGAMIFHPASNGCSCEGDARIEEQNAVAADETMVNCRCAVNFDGLAQDFGGAPESLILDLPSCLPEDLNVYIASDERAAELAAMSDEEYSALIAEFCDTRVRDTVTAAIGFLKGEACGHFEVANCAPVDPSGLGGRASARNDVCEQPCQSVECNDETCNPDEVAPDIETIDVTQCACTDLNGCGTSVQLCTPPPVFDSSGMGSSSDALTAAPASGLLTRLTMPTTRVAVDPAFSDAFITMEFCEDVIVEVCTSDSDSAAVGGFVNLYGRPCPGQSCTMGLETWLRADDIDLEFDVTVIEVGEAHIRDLELSARTEADGVQIAADGSATIAPGALHIVASGVESGERFVFRDVNEAAIPISIDFAAGTFSLSGFRVDFDEGHATLDLDGTFAAGVVVADAGPDQLVECATFAGAPLTLSGSSNASEGAVYSWWQSDAFAVPVTTAEFSGPVLETVAPLGTTSYHLTVMGGALGVASDSLVVTVEDTTPPELSVSVAPNVIWSPNRQYVAVHVTATASDACSEAVAVRLVAVNASEPGVAQPVPAEDVRSAALGTADFDLELRATRRGAASQGRIYELVYEAEDGSGNVTVSSATVLVPHSVPLP